MMSSSRSSRHEPAGPTPNSRCGPRAFSEGTSRWPEPARATIIGEGFWRGVTIRLGRRLTAS